MRTWNRMLGCLLALFLCPGISLAWEPDVLRWQARLKKLTQTVGTRQSFTPEESLAFQYLWEELRAMGYSDQELFCQLMAVPPAVTRKTGIQNMSNLVAVKRALKENPTVIILSAHYDTVSTSLGVKDNGSGVAALLTMADCFRKLPPFPDTELRFVFFTAEEKGELGSGYYTMTLTVEERERILGMFNIDLITLEEGAEDMAFSCDTLGGRTPEGYREGREELPVENTVSRAILRALWEEEDFTPELLGARFFIPRHFGDSDHLRFHQIGVDAANLSFRGSPAAGGLWPADMHTFEDGVKPFDLGLTQLALNVIFRAVSELARDPDYGASSPLDQPWKMVYSK